MLSIHYYKAIGHYCLYYVSATEYKITYVFTNKTTARIYGFVHGLKVHEF